MFENLTYAVVDLTASPKPEKAWYNQLRKKGVTQSSSMVISKSVDGTKMIITWEHGKNLKPPSATPHTIFEGTHAQITQYLIDNSAEWVTVIGE